MRPVPEPGLGVPADRWNAHDRRETEDLRDRIAVEDASKASDGQRADYPAGCEDSRVGRDPRSLGTLQDNLIHDASSGRSQICCQHCKRACRVRTTLDGSGAERRETGTTPRKLLCLAGRSWTAAGTDRQRVVPVRQRVGALAWMCMLAPGRRVRRTGRLSLSGRPATVPAFRRGLACSTARGATRRQHCILRIEEARRVGSRPTLARCLLDTRDRWRALAV